MAVGAGTQGVGGTSTDTAGMSALSNALEKFSASQNVSAIQSLNSQLASLGKAMNIESLPKLIQELQRLNIITKDQAEQLLKLRQPSLGFIGNLKAIGTALMQGNVSGAVSHLGSALGGMAKSIGGVTAIAIAAPAAIIAMGAAIQGLVAKTNPSVAFQFNLALQDLMATMGQALTPLLQGITVFTRAFADALQGLMPALQSIMGGVGQLVAALAPLLQSLMELLGPGLQLIGDIIGNIVVPAVQLLADALTGIVSVIKKVISTLTFGLVSFDEYKAKSSVGAAIRPAQYSGIEEIGKRTTMSALNTTDRTSIPGKIDTANSWLSKIFDKLGGKSTSEIVGNNWAGRAVKGFDDVGKWISKQWRDL